MTPATPLRVLPGQRVWNAHWIWDARSTATANTRRLFRRIFSLREGEADAAECFLSAATRYRLFVNGRRIADGPPHGGYHRRYFDRHDLSEALHEGRNCIAVLVYAESPGDGGLICELRNSDGPLLETDASWRCLHPSAWREDSHRARMNHYAPFQEHLDGRLLPADWMGPEFDDANWPAAKTVGKPPRGLAQTLVERDIPPLEETVVHATGVTGTEECLGILNRQRSADLSISLSAAGRPLSLARVEAVEALLSGREGCVLAGSLREDSPAADGVYDPCIVLDFGRVLTAQLEFECTAPGGAILEVGYAERLVDGHFNNAMESPFADGYTCREGRQTVRFLFWRAFRFLKLRLRNCPQELKLHALHAIRVRYPFQERGGFHATDAVLNSVFEISRETLRLCSVDQLMDTPWREGAQWLGDVAAVTLGGIYACFGDTRMPAKFLHQSAACAQPCGLLQNTSHRETGGAGGGTIPDYSLWWIMALREHYRYTGEEAWVRTYYPDVQRILRWHLPHLNDRGFLANLPGWIFIDWAAVDREGCSGVYNALFSAALEAARAMAEFVGDRDTADWTDRLATAIRRDFVSMFYDQERGVFADARCNGRLSPTISEHTNFAALLWGCCDDELSHDIVKRFCIDQSVPEAVECQPFFSSVVLRALQRLGRTDLALEVIRKRWGDRMVARGATSCYEEWTYNGSLRSGEWQGIVRTHSHAWSGYPAEFLVRLLSGFEILAPGCTRVGVTPYAADFEYECTIPTPCGDIRVRHAAGASTVEAPRDMNVVRPRGVKLVKRQTDTSPGPVPR